MAESKRLQMLIQMTGTPEADPFALYALAMEYKSNDMFADALATFRRLRDKNPAYLPMYLICGTMLIGHRDRDAARDWLQAGLSVARQQGDSHAIGEIEAALASIDDATG
jgi:hypothetical protein